MRRRCDDRQGSPEALDDRAVRTLRGAATSARPARLTDYDPLLEAVGDARFVLIGEASHGTHEFYRERAADHASG